MLEPYSVEVVWIVVVGFLVAFILAFGVGANDVANSFGTSVGAKVLTLRQACILATIFEVLGAVLIGSKVSDTVRKGIFDVKIYDNQERELMLASLAALTGSAAWNILATFLRLPISGTHSIVGAILGFSLVSKGVAGIRWKTMGTIVASWFISPIMSGIVSSLIFLSIRHFILKKKNPLEPGLRSLPIFYGTTILINIFSVVHDGPEMLKFNVVPWWGALIIAVGLGLIVGIIVFTVVVPHQRKVILEGMKEQSDISNDIENEAHDFQLENLKANNCECITYKQNEINNIHNKEKDHILENGDCKANGIEKVIIPSNKDYIPLSKQTTISTPNDSDGYASTNSSNSLVQGKTEITFIKMSDDQQSMTLPLESKSEEDKPEVSKLFSLLQILTAVFGSFAHGGNDVSNAVGPVVAIWMIYAEGEVHQKSSTPILILLYGGIGISIGLWVWGRRVIKTLGEDLTKITPSSGFTIEIGAATTVLLASKIGLPVSSTHCKVGSIVFVGWIRSKQGVDWRLFGNIILAWVLTLPVTCGLSAAVMAILYAVAC
ncbi:sodium-dependent phosphate transporter 1-B-like [Centruroides sculpturatus]|uniref:sodium-dependent phosphate transporter 1-B-like n=1 Tax=Centruroides sculpturatus TaxID=218467 RepID=UPI000C6E76E2|nr:sodium-dependent phosphate transporter 1-B-like [Centruroides sculpturatus]XP_023236822.1 sodium-dependent phosphate transporter 1-B-like [Centruroides sculpturatus]XP_023236823.1 sodium-dependent phosphate transporter 1-B-like [Centruroides sculpturatus]XP_023236824.1 sodium-dependent phosphate transporter 1-B-like [Centruroides sculpturatus]XP_023236825.1 sodium-dependent phosphate transporter 1-B-like [Centruroides sculpturatus]XP_023236826.1 sodium-dependent phosphate transporter 1-B-li